jgi:hypothetical protein
VHPLGDASSPGNLRAFGKLLIDCEDDRMLRAVLVEMLMERPSP